jgi:polysaccharide pyruvyl transferase WcaK-like protein
MKILLTNCWQAGNTGDVAIWKNLMKHLVNAFPNAEFLIASQVLLDWDVNQLIEYNVKFYLNNLNQAVKDADVVISQGGGYMIGDGMITYLKSMQMAQNLGKPTFYSTQTFVGPISKETSDLLKNVLNNALVVSPRDQGTYDLMVNAGVDKSKLEIVPDTVFDIGINHYKDQYPDSIKFSVRSYMINTDIVKEFAKLADMVSETMGQVVFIPIGHGGDRDDRQISKEIAGYMKHDSVIIEDRLCAEELKSLLKDGMLISGRYHGLIYAASMCTPFIPITPDIGSKTPGLLELLDYPIKEPFDKLTLSAEKIFPQVLEVWENRIKYRELLKMKLPDIKEKSALVYQKIIDGIKHANIN